MTEERDSPMSCPNTEVNITGYKGPERRKQCEQADMAAEKAVKNVFSILGVNIDEPKEVREFQDSLRFGDRLRKTADKGIIAFIVSLAGLLGAALFVGLKSKFTGNP